jgi:hypothetical protein
LRGPRPVSLSAAALLAALLLALPLAFSCGRAPAPAAPGSARLSLLAVGDTGWPRLVTHAFSPQLVVARGMAAEDRRSPIDALVLLGDNFYPNGLRAGELVSRVRQNLVEPYCRFVELKGWASPQAADACPLPEAERHPVPIYAVLGNHDYDARESPALELDVVPWFISNWTLPDGLARTYELGEGVSLILFESGPIYQGKDPSALRDAIRKARGPWRILAAHRPMKTPESRMPRRSALARAYVESVRRAIAEAGLPVHLYLAGHEHNLQVLTMEPPAPPLHVVAGSGGSIRTVKPGVPTPRFTAEQLGFVRVDLVGEGDEARLVASLFTTPRLTLSSSKGPRLVARWSVNRRGEAREEKIETGGEAD